jgi:hypothetical protein
VKPAERGGWSISGDDFGGQLALDSIEVGATEEISALRTDQLAVVLLQVCRTVGTNLRGLPRTTVRGFSYKVGAGQKMRILTYSVRHVYTGDNGARSYHKTKFGTATKKTDGGIRSAPKRARGDTTGRSGIPY